MNESVSAGRLATFLTTASPSAYCLACLVTQFDAAEEDVREAAQILLIRSGDFQVVREPCQGCRRMEDAMVYGRPTG